MAEFQKVIRQFDRLCKAHAMCNGCPLYESNGADRCGISALINDSERVECKIMTWAAEHPELVYPTWYSWLANMGVVPVELPPDQAVMVTDIGLLKKIPADIAQKLGIEPKEEQHEQAG